MPDQESITEDKQEKETEAIQMPNWLELWKEFYFQQEKDAARIFREFISNLQLIINPFYHLFLPFILFSTLIRFFWWSWRYSLQRSFCSIRPVSYLFSPSPSSRPQSLHCI